jgi:hypothetical protein
MPLSALLAEVNSGSVEVADLAQQGEAQVEEAVFLGEDNVCQGTRAGAVSMERSEHVN